MKSNVKRANEPFFAQGLHEVGQALGAQANDYFVCQGANVSRTIKGVKLVKSIRKPLAPPSKVHKPKTSEEPRIPFCWQCGEHHTAAELCASE
jgi:hypothetical protein